MTVIAQTDADFVFEGIPPIADSDPAEADGAPADAPPLAAQADGTPGQPPSPPAAAAPPPVEADAATQAAAAAASPPAPTTHAAAAPPRPAAAAAKPRDPLGLLAQLPGTWTGHGFNTIWRPHRLSTGQDRFLELNLTTETLVFTRIHGAIPNRGLLMADINMFGLTYMQQIAETKGGAGLHIEPGIWATVPPTSDPNEPATVVRMASIPHGTVILAQGRAFRVRGGPRIDDNNIIPFTIGSPPPPNSDFPAAEGVFTELNLAIPSAFRFASPGVTQAMVTNPNSVLKTAIQGKTITGTTVLVISTTHTPVAGGGTANTAFLEAGSNPPGGNADAVEVTAIFWIETVKGAPGKPDRLQLQYTQLVQLDFNGLRWPHVTVATLHKH